MHWQSGNPSHVLNRVQIAGVIDAAVQGEQPGILSKGKEAVEVVALLRLDRAGDLVPGHEERRPLAERGRLHLDKTLAPIRLEGKHVVAETVSAGPRHVLDALGKLRLARGVQPLRLEAEHQLFAGPAERLTALDIEDLNRLYQLGFRAGFPPSVLDDGVYYGVRVRGRLVSAAGTHAINPREGIAVVGNVMTHADFRGHDFAKMVTSAVTAELLDRVEDVALNVHADNGPAVAAYTRLGYGTHCQLVERLARRRHGGWGLMRPIREAMRIPWQRESK